MPISNLTEEPSTGIRDNLAGHPVCEALSAGRPDRMGVTHRWDMARFLKESDSVTPQGEPHGNFCIGCDRFHDEVRVSEITELREERALARADRMPDRIDTALV